MLREPVRVWIYSVLVALVAVLVAYGVIDSEQAPLWIALGAAVLGVAGTEAARAKVTPVDSLDHGGPDVDPNSVS